MEPNVYFLRQRKHEICSDIHIPKFHRIESVETVEIFFYENGIKKFTQYKMSNFS